MKNILINFPTNIGDVILALPVLDRVRSNYPYDKISAIVSVRNKDFLLKNTLIDEIVVFDKYWKPLQKMRFTLALRGKYDIMVDLKNSFLPALLGVKLRTSFIRRFSNKIHIVDKYQKIAAPLAPSLGTIQSDFILEPEKIKEWETLKLDKDVFIACTSLSATKQYPVANVRKVIDELPSRKKAVVLGNTQDREFYGDVLVKKNVVDLVGKTSMLDVFYLLKHKACMLLGVDSSITHMASYLGVAVVAIFGPTSFERSCPRSKGSVVLKKESLACLACEMSNCSADNECMDINPKQVSSAIRKIVDSDENL
jgi:lipopolysaccharide heptosyltransferase I